ncbi:2-dehydropantoate 2-reductase N-terminal domain-containing protein [Oricola sp.]|uniref:ketopantoate reductase family protein n=1 Tax=Oricola sp. TaxID=1979950 RepID=UPI0025FADC6A|nr:2-dehydropantoate 2-reductase N-terminal domain-containing protein [Oricola sp.]MCI5074030.1 NAD(P)-binding domain-containing protein [Oricola sp.]
MNQETTRDPRIAFLGTGAQGASIAADFALAGLDVTLIDQWPAHVEAIRENGITVNLPTRTINAKAPALHLCEVAEVKEPFDIVFLVVKAYDTRWACELIKPVLAPDGLVVGLQNGMSHKDIAAVVGRERTVGAVIQIASNMWTPGVTTRQNDHDDSWFALGALDPETQQRVQGVAELLRHSGTVEVHEDIHSAKWMKLVVNAAELIPSAIINTELRGATRVPGMFEVMRAAGYEAMQAALADGATIMPIIGMPPVMSNHPDRYVDEIFEKVLTTYSEEDTLTTSLQDWRKGRRAEVDDVNGWVVETLRAQGRKAPVNQRVVEIAIEIEAGKLDLKTENAALMIEAYKAAAKDG